jgi:hypothetical protein
MIPCIHKGYILNIFAFYTLLNYSFGGKIVKKERKQEEEKKKGKKNIK